jgi:hypothetical protein
MPYPTAQTLGDLMAQSMYSSSAGTPSPGVPTVYGAGMPALMPNAPLPLRPQQPLMQPNMPVDQMDRLPPASPYYDRNAIQPNDIMRQYFDLRNLTQERI